jgi:hypothetical protein
MAYTTIDDPSAYFKVQLYTGNGSANHAITFDDTDTDMQPDLVWIKNRDATDEHCMFDSVRGATKMIGTNVTAEQATDTDTLDSFTSDGFQVDADDKVNTNTEKYVSWNWKESATAGFDIVQYTGTGSATTHAHSLSAVPHFILIKQHNTGRHWSCYHHKNTSAPETEYLTPSLTSATIDRSADYNDTAPTSSVWSVGTQDETNGSSPGGVSHIAYLWSEKQGFSKFGSYTGNGNADGTFAYTGFRPAFVMLKRTDSTGGWYMYDNKRAGYNGSSGYLQGNDSSAEDTNAGNFGFDILSNGFKLKGTYATVNNSGGNYVFMAFAEAPFVNSNGVPCNAR